MIQSYIHITADLVDNISADIETAYMMNITSTDTARGTFTSQIFGLLNARHTSVNLPYVHKTAEVG